MTMCSNYIKEKNVQLPKSVKEKMVPNPKTVRYNCRLLVLNTNTNFDTYC